MKVKFNDHWSSYKEFYNFYINFKINCIYKNFIKFTEHLDISKFKYCEHSTDSKSLELFLEKDVCVF